MKNWIVEKDVPILPEHGKQHWSDLDLLAIGEEVHIINCKDFLPSSKQKDKIVSNLNTAEIYIKSKYDFLKDKTFKKIYIYGGTDKNTIVYLSKNGIETIPLEEIFCRYIQLLDSFLTKLNENKSPIKKGTRYYRVGSLANIDRVISYLLNNSFINEDKVNKKLEEMQLLKLSSLKN